MKYNKLLVLAAASLAFMTSCNKNADQELLDKINTILRQDASKINTCYDAIQDIEANHIELNEHTLSNVNFEFVYDSRQKQFIIMDGDDIVRKSSGYKENENTLDLFKSVMVYNTNSKYSQYLDKRAAVPEEKLYITTGFDIGEHRDIPRITYNNVSDIGRDVIIRTYSDYFEIQAPNDTIHHYEVATNVIINDVKRYESHAETSFINATKGNMYFADGSSTDFFEAVNPDDVKLEVADGTTFNATINIDNPKAETGEGLELELVNAKNENEIETALNKSYQFIHLENDISCADELNIGSTDGGNCIDLAGFKLSFDKSESSEPYAAINVAKQQSLYIIDSQSVLDDNSGIELNDCYIQVQGGNSITEPAILMINGGKITQKITTDDLSATVMCIGASKEQDSDESTVHYSNFYMYGGKIESIMSDDAEAASCISSYGKGANVEIVYGNFISDTCCVACDPYSGGTGEADYLGGSTLTIDGGHFASSLKTEGACIEYGVNATIIINGGEFEGDTVLTMKDGVANIKGATFNATKQSRPEVVGADGSAINIYNGTDLKIDIKDSNIYSKFGYVLSTLGNSKAEVNFHEGTYSYYLGNGLSILSGDVEYTIDNPSNFVQHSI